MRRRNNGLDSNKRTDEIERYGGKGWDRSRADEESNKVMDKFMMDGKT